MSISRAKGLMKQLKGQDLGSRVHLVLDNTAACVCSELSYRFPLESLKHDLIRRVKSEKLSGNCKLLLLFAVDLNLLTKCNRSACNKRPYNRLYLSGVPRGVFGG